MYYNKLINEDKDKLIIKISIFTLLINLLIFMCIFNKVKAGSDKKYSRNNLSYVQIINYTLPSVKVLNFDEEDMVENSYSIKNLALSVIGIDIYNPEKILSKEISCFDSDDMSDSKMAFNNNQNSSNVGDFNLNSSDISKVSSENNNSSNSKNTVSPVYDPKLKKPLDESKPEVLIYHSHTTESYKPYNQDDFDDDHNVCAVGDELVKELEQNYGISAINDKTLHNAVYTKSYTRSGETVDKYMKKYGDFKMIIDMHRDSSPDKTSVTTKINGENVAKFMFVMARKNPHYAKNIAMVNSLVSLTNKYFPQMFNGIYYYDYGTNYFNQAKSNNAFLIEIGSQVNTLDEAKATQKYIARVIAEYLNGKK
ncbi:MULTISPECIES: stage II sporulation protein P [Clostridium]|uniref:stage II sporulation protein P n=1 Tax=Clostridium TaxID=1485 RepID=UPI00069CD74E|nr:MULTISPECIES: stage II sporulation protein P [Clostridium]KOF57005.1 stage II sporulation protein P [Clostridium sp. DMHC 10]MCD2347534.1 stage II sporulation protein P [Clostridium guangxiense]